MVVASRNPLERLRPLAEPLATDGAALTVTLDLPPGQLTGRIRETAVNSLTETLEEAAAAFAERLEHAGRRALDADVARVSSYLSTDPGPTVGRGVAVCACAPAEVFEARYVPWPVETSTVVGRTFALAALLRPPGAALEAVVAILGRAQGRLADLDAVEIAALLRFRNGASG